MATSKSLPRLVVHYLQFLGDKRSDRVRLVGLLALMILSAGAELAGVGVVFPYIALLDDNASGTLPAGITTFAARHSKAEVALVGGLVLGTVFFAKNALVALTHSTTMSFAYRKMRENSLALLRAYLARPYTFHVTENSAGATKAVVQDMANIFSAAIPATMNILAETFTVGLIGLVLLALNPIPILSSTIIIGVGAWATQRVLSQRLNALGRTGRDHEAKMLQATQEALGAIKEVKTAGKDEYFLGSFAGEVGDLSTTLARYRTLAYVPRYILETLGIVGMATTAAALVALTPESQRETIVPTLGFMAVAVVRILPAATRVVAAASDLRYYENISATLLATLRETQNREAELSIDAAQVPRLSMRAVSFAHQGKEILTIDDVSLELFEGEIVTVVGGSGAGKTTLMDLAAGLLPPAAGMITHRDTRIGYVAQNVFLTDDSIAQNVALSEQFDEARVAWALEVVSLRPFVDGLPHGLATKVGERGARISGGQRQRIGIARALYLEPTLLLLDEATSALDGETEAQVLRALRALPSRPAIMSIAHRASTARCADHVVVLSAGAIVGRGSFDSLLRNCVELQRIFPSEQSEPEFVKPEATMEAS